jgi:hypothetical protein
MRERRADPGLVSARALILTARHHALRVCSHDCACALLPDDGGGETTHHLARRDPIPRMTQRAQIFRRPRLIESIH